MREGAFTAGGSDLRKTESQKLKLLGNIQELRRKMARVIKRTHVKRARATASEKNGHSEIITPTTESGMISLLLFYFMFADAFPFHRE